MVDIEPMLKYNSYKNIGFRSIHDCIIIFYLAVIIPIYAILNYSITSEKMVLQYIMSKCFEILKPKFYKVSKRDIINDKNIMYFTNHVSVGDFSIDPHIMNYSIKFISLNKIKVSLPILSAVISLTNTGFFIPEGAKKHQVIDNLKRIEEWRKSDNIRNLMLYPEGMRRNHRPNPSEVLKKGFIYHSFENMLPIQIIHTTNKDYVIDDTKFLFNKNINLFTYYGPKIDPAKLKERYEKKHKKEYTKDDYYDDVYKQWCKIWKKMDKYRIDSYIAKGLSYEESVKITDNLCADLPVIETKIRNGEAPLSKWFILLRSFLWALIYYCIYRVIDKIFEKCFSFCKTVKMSAASAASAAPTSITPRNSIFRIFSFLQNYVISPASPVSCVVP